MGKKIPPDVWAEVKTLWCAGKGTFEQLSKKYKIAVDTLKTHSSKEGWKRDKEEVQQEIREKVAETTEEMLSRLGLPKEKRLRLLIEGAEDDDKQIRLSYLKEIHSLTGEYAPVKRSTDITSKGKSIQSPFAGLSDEELLAMIERKKERLTMGKKDALCASTSRG